MTINRTNTLFLLILILALFLRFFYLGKIPNGLYSDEAAYGYNAYSILKTGRDEYGELFPIAFRSFGDYKAPLYIYSLVPFVSIFGLTEFSVRIASALLGVVTVGIIFILGKYIFGENSIALLGSFFVAISPFALQFNRMAHENNLSLVLILLGILFFIMSLKSIKYIFHSLTFFAASMYAYIDARVIIPLLLIMFVILYRKYFWQMKKKLSLSILIFIIILLPLINSLRSQVFWSRPSFINIFSDKGIIYAINLERGEDIKHAFFAPVIFHNKVLTFVLKFLENYAKHYSFDFLFFYGDPVKIYQTVGQGILYIATLPFLFLGIYFIFQSRNQYKWLMLMWLLIAPVPGALTRLVPSASRVLPLLPVLAIIQATGLIFPLISIKNVFIKKIYLIFITIAIGFNVTYYLHYYYVNTPIRYAREWHHGMRETIERVKIIQDQYSTVWFSKNAWGYIYPLFYLSYPPEKYQPQARLSPLNEFGFGWVREFDKYIFDDFPLDLNTRENTLFIGAPSDFYKLKKPLHTIYYPDGSIAFHLVDQSSF